MSDGGQDFFLVLDVIDLLQLQHLGDGQHLERKVLVARRVLDQHNTTERPRTCSQSINQSMEQFNVLQVITRNRACRIKTKLGLMLQQWRRID